MINDYWAPVVLETERGCTGPAPGFCCTTERSGDSICVKKEQYPFLFFYNFRDLALSVFFCQKRGMFLHSTLKKVCHKTTTKTPQDGIIINAWGEKYAYSDIVLLEDTKETALNESVLIYLFIPSPLPSATATVSFRRAGRGVTVPCQRQSISQPSLR